MLALVRVRPALPRVAVAHALLRPCGGFDAAGLPGTALAAQRFFAGRSSSSRKPPSSDGGSSPSKAVSRHEQPKQEANDAPASGGSAGASAAAPVAGTGAGDTAGGPAAARPAASAAQAGGDNNGGRGGPAVPGTVPKKTTSAPALFALPLYRKPAFPGFYQTVQISEQEVLDFLFALRKNGQGEYIGGFMTTQLPSGVEESDVHEAPSTPASGAPAVAASQSLRRDAGRVSSVSELEEIGTVLQVINLTQYPNISGGQVVIMPHRRIRRTRELSAPSPNVALAAVSVEYLPEPEVLDNDSVIKETQNEIADLMKELIRVSMLYKEQFDQVIRFYDIANPLKLADLVAGMSMVPRQQLQAVLVENDLAKRLKQVHAVVKKDLELAKLQSHVKEQVEEKVTKEQRRLMLMDQMRQIVKELGIEKDDKQTLITAFHEAIQGKTLPEEASKVIESELAKLGTLEPSSSEFNVCRTYLEWLTCLPWGQYTEENKDIVRAEKILDEDHYGLEDVKERILEHIAVSFLKETVQGKIMCMVGPPGVGKTSIGQSIARALDRKFFRFSVGGLHDVAELRGHRRTYVGAMPGKLIQCLKITQSSNPVVLIDEIDKLGRDFRGDPSSALLEILDPEQNNTFRDHYLDVPVDLSRVLFVCTANGTDGIPLPLLDRMEVIRLAGYVHEEKVAIANQFLIPQTKEQSGVSDDALELLQDTLQVMIKDYAREAGVRELRKLLEKVSRKVALSVVRQQPSEQPAEKVSVTTDNLSKYIGQPIHLSDRLYTLSTPPGVVMGLAWTSLGGASLFVEATGRLPHDVETDAAEALAGLGDGGCGAERQGGDSSGGALGGSMKVTGQLGNVMGESSEIALTYARLFVRELAICNTFLEEARIHLNVPEGATPKDGPSAGVTMATALVSLALDRPVRTDLAMTGELTLTGKVLKVGGIKEKVIAARRDGASEILFPRQNEADFRELKDYLRSGITAHFVDHYDDVYRLAFREDEVPSLSWSTRGYPLVTVLPPAEDNLREDEAPRGGDGGGGEGLPRIGELPGLQITEVPARMPLGPPVAPLA